MKIYNGRVTVTVNGVPLANFREFTLTTREVDFAIQPFTGRERNRVCATRWAAMNATERKEHRARRSEWRQNYGTRR